MNSPLRECLQRLWAQAAWADERVLQALRGLRAVPEDALTLFAHVLETEHLYHARMSGADPWPQDFWPALDLDGCAARCEDNDALYRASLGAGDGAWSEARLLTPVAYRDSRGSSYETSPVDMLTHLALHGSYHRGQIARALGSAGASPAVTDYITFTREMP